MVTWITLLLICLTDVLCILKTHKEKGIMQVLEPAGLQELCKTVI